MKEYLGTFIQWLVGAGVALGGYFIAKSATKSMAEDEKKKTIALIIVIVAVVLGFYIGYLLGGMLAGFVTEMMGTATSGDGGSGSSDPRSTTTAYQMTYN